LIVQWQYALAKDLLGFALAQHNEATL
jgi:hypothetical protein